MIAVASAPIVRQSTYQGKRTIWVVMDRLVMPYHRQTQRSKHADPKAVEYNAWAGSLRTEVWDAMKRENIEPFPVEARLEMSMTIALAPKEVWVNRNGKRYARVTHPSETQDVDNLGKGLVDAVQGALFANDKRIFHVSVTKEEGESDSFSIRLVEM